VTTSQPRVRTPASAPDQTLKRRGLLAAGAAFVAGLIAKLSEQSVSAGIDGDVVLGQPNTTSTVTSAINTTGFSTALELTCTASTFSWRVVAKRKDIKGGARVADDFDDV
jgi:hypothetical protein